MNRLNLLSFESKIDPAARNELFSWGPLPTFDALPIWYTHIAAQLMLELIFLSLPLADSDVGADATLAVSLHWKDSREM